MLKSTVCALCLGLSIGFAQAQKVVKDSAQHQANEPLKFSDQLLQFAQKHLHLRYRSGGMSPKGFDCSGFVHFCFKQFSLVLPHSSAAQGLLGNEINQDNAKPGDLIFFKGSNSKSSRIGHVGIITEVTSKSIKFIHSAWNGGVRYDVLHADYYRQRFVGIRRVIGVL